MHHLLCHPTIRFAYPVSLQQKDQTVFSSAFADDPVSNNPFGRNTTQEDITYPDLLSLNWFDNQNITGFQQGLHTAALRCEAQGDTSM